MGNREIKFRGQRVGGEWLYFDLKNYCENDDNQELPKFLEYVLRNICQFTGLKDKNGVEIYENDIVCNPQGIKSKVIWYSNGFYLCSLNKYNQVMYIPCDDLGILDNKEIIGNIHENPELLCQ